MKLLIIKTFNMAISVFVASRLNIFCANCRSSMNLLIISLLLYVKRFVSSDNALICLLSSFNVSCIGIIIPFIRRYMFAHNNRKFLNNLGSAAGLIAIDVFSLFLSGSIKVLKLVVSLFSHSTSCCSFSIPRITIVLWLSCHCLIYGSSLCSIQSCATAWQLCTACWAGGKSFLVRIYIFIYFSYGGAARI